jgi:hypothetical protein
MNESDYWSQMYQNAINASLPSAIYRPRVFIDGNKWCALYGDDIQCGVAGFGDSPELAMWNFDFEWCKKLEIANELN